MSKERRRSTKRRTIFVAIATAIVSISIPAAAAAQGNIVNDLVKGVNGLVGGGAGSGSSAPAPTQQAAPENRAGVPPAYTPPLHGANPHGQGSVAVGDLLPSNNAPLGNDPATGEEEIIVGDSAGSQENGAYNGRVTLLGVNIGGLINTYTLPVVSDLLTIRTAPGQTNNGPLAPLQAAIDGVCAAIPGNAAGCVTVAGMNSSTTTTGSNNSFQAAGTNLNVVGANVTTGVAGSQGNINEAGGCQAATGSSSIANASVGLGGVLPAITASALNASSTSQACQGGANTQSNSSEVLNLAGAGLPLPAAGCADGTPNTNFTPLAPLISLVCNADTSNSGQTATPYGVREALTVFALAVGPTPLLKVAASGPESHAVAPAATTPTTPTTPTAQTPGAGTNPGTGGGNPGGPGGDRDGPGDPDPVTGDVQDGDGELAFTGSNLILLALIGGSLLLAGTALAATAGRHRRETA